MECNMSKYVNIFSKYKYPVLILVIGLVLMLLPGSNTYANEYEGDNKIEQMLSCTQGVGEAKVLVSDNGVVVVCRGATNPSVRLEIINAISAYTGFTSDKITVLKMAD